MNLIQQYQKNLYIPPSQKAIKATIDEILNLAGFLEKHIEDYVKLVRNELNGIKNPDIREETRKAQTVFRPFDRAVF